MTKLIRSLLFCTLLLGMAAAQTAVVKRDVNLRSDPSTTNDPIVLLTPPAQLQLIETDPTNGFYHVKTNDNQEGWVWARNVTIQATGGDHPGNDGTGDGTAATGISSDWEKPDPQSSVFHGQEGDCGESGDGGDSVTNPRKNRKDVPATYHLVTWNAINDLSVPQGAPKSLDNWTDAQLAQITPFQGVAVSVEGFLFKVKVESSSANAKKGGESTNCHFHLAADVDWHMPFTAGSSDGEDAAVIVETTPRIRQQHPNWTVNNLKPWTGTGQKVRISGWLMIDPEHQDMINSGLRSTLWEVHPVTKIEVFKNGQWVDLDNLQ